MNILIVEDEVDLLDEYKIFLESHGHKVTSLDNGESALKTYFSKYQPETDSLPFDVLVLDYQLPGKNGMQIAQEILEKCPRQRILFASAYVEDTLKESIKNLKQIIDLLQKPFRLQEMLDIIEDTSTYEELEKLNVDIKNLKEIEPTHSQIITYLNILKKLHDKAR